MKKIKLIISLLIALSTLSESNAYSQIVEFSKQVAAFKEDENI